MSCGATIQVFFPHKCSQLSWCSTLNVKVMVIFTDISSLLYLHVSDVFHSAFPFLCKWPIKVLPRCIHSSSSNDGFVHVPSSNLVHVSGLDWCMNSPLPILRLGLWALCCVRILSSHRNIRSY